MPPPPPSKSYLLKFDDLSDSEDERYDERRFEHRYKNDAEVPHLVRSKSSLSSSRSSGDDEEIDEILKAAVKQLDISPASSPHTVISDVRCDDMRSKTNESVPIVVSPDRKVNVLRNDIFNGRADDARPIPSLDNMIPPDDDGVSDDEEEDNEDQEEDDDNYHPDAPKKKRKKKKSKKKKKKKGKNQASSSSSISTSCIPVSTAKVAKNVTFGNVTVIEFERCFGLDVVPYDGGWPLGMSMHAVDVPGDSQPSRNIQIEKNRSKDKSSVTVGTELSITEYEEIRQGLLLDRWNALKSNNVEDTSDLCHPLETRQWDYKRKCKNPLFRLLSEKERMLILIASSSPENLNLHCPSFATVGSVGRSRSGSFSETSSSAGSVATASKGRTRSCSTDKSITEMYNETYSQMEVHSVRNELERIRNSRSMEDATGCTCRKLHVYLMPADGGGKKANHRRMKIQQVKTELRKRHILPSEPKTREELEQLLHDAVEQEPCCSSEDCPCFKNGIGCQADTCSCWYASHQTTEQQRKMKLQQTDSMIPASEIQARCGNKYGMYAVDTETIDEFRKKYITCQFINA